jgi:hypothetical protein
VQAYESPPLARHVVLARAWATSRTYAVTAVVVGISSRLRIDLDAVSSSAGTVTRLHAGGPPMASGPVAGRW